MTTLPALIWRAPPGDVAAQVWHATLNGPDAGASPRDLRRHAHRLRTEILCHVLGCTADDLTLGRRPCPGCGAPHGKPFVLHPQPTTLDVSLSHSGRHSLVAVADGGVIGVDVQRLAGSGRARRLARLALTPGEQAATRDLDGSELSRRVIGCWARKEACLKAAGFGLTIPLRRIEAGLPPQPPAREVVIAARGWVVFDLGVGRDAAAAVALAA